MATITQFLNVARSQIGYREGSNNDNKYGIWYGSGWNNQPYCAMGLSWVAAQVPNGPAAIGGKWAYCPYWADWFRSKGHLYSAPQRGDIAFFDWTGLKRSGEEMHVGIVEEVNADYVTTIEFNTVAGSGDQSDGGGVYRRIRHVSMVVGFGRPFYDAETNVKPVDSTKHIPLVVDGAWGPLTTKRLQEMLKVKVDGDIGPVTLRALSKWAGTSQVSVWTDTLRRALQRKLGVPADGIIGPATVKALQRYLNRNS
jgi:hypothetical protein